MGNVSPENVDVGGSTPQGELALLAELKTHFPSVFAGGEIRSFWVFREEVLPPILFGLGVPVECKIAVSLFVPAKLFKNPTQLEIDCSSVVHAVF